MAASSTDNQRRASALPALGMRIVIFAALAVGMMIVDQRRDDLDALRRGIGVVVYPIQALVSLPSRFIDWSSRATVSRADLERENNSLRVERLRTRAELQRFNDLQAENQRLRSMLNAAQEVADEFNMAEIMAVEANPYRHSIRINKGRDFGVFEGQAMVDASGVVGQVTDVGPFSSIAVLISDPDHALPVAFVRNGLRTIAVGTGEFDRLELPFLPNNADVEIGDKLVTSGLGGAFPAGYPVATVSTIELKPGRPFAELEATPAAALSQVREVVLISRPPTSRDDGDESEAEAAGSEPESDPDAALDDGD